MSYYKFELNSDHIDGICDAFGLQKISLLRSFTQATGIQLLLREYGMEPNNANKIFNEEDVINIFPVVKHINPRATDAYNFYTTGQSKIQQGYLKVCILRARRASYYFIMRLNLLQVCLLYCNCVQFL